MTTEALAKKLTKIANQTGGETEVLPQRSMRVEDDLWAAAMQKAKTEDLTLSQVIRRFLKEYVETPARRRKS